jgi:hypothetical protein
VEGGHPARVDFGETSCKRALLASMTKKTGPRNLKLSTTTIANLSAKDLASVGGALPRNTANMSVCWEQCCKSDYCSGSAGC